MRTIRDSVRVERPAIHRSKAEDEARAAVTKTAMVQVAAAGKVGRQEVDSPPFDSEGLEALAVGKVRDANHVRQPRLDQAV